jgi:hypothetical protein
MQEVIMKQTVVTPQLTTAASMLVRLAQPGNSSLHRALEKAEGRLISQPWRVDDGVLHIVSFTHQNEVHLTDGVDCSCPTTRGTCYHKAAWFILSTLAAAGCSPVANLPLPSALDVDELPGSFLDGDFSAFDDDSLTHDQYGKLLPEFAPAPAFEEVDQLPPAQPFRLQPSRVLVNPLDADVDALFGRVA